MKILTTPAPKRPPVFRVHTRGLVAGQPSGVDAAALAELAAKENGAPFLRAVDMLIRGVHPVTEAELPAHKRLSWETIESLEPYRRNLDGAGGRPTVMVQVLDGQRSVINAAALPMLVSSLNSAYMVERLAAFPSIVDRLVTEVDDMQETTTLVGHLSDGVKEQEQTIETEEWPHIGATSEKYKIGHLRNGRQIAFSQDLIDRSNIPGIIERLNVLADISRELIERRGIRLIFDYYGSKATPAVPYVMDRTALGVSGGAAIYSTTAIDATRVPGGTELQNNALVSDANLEAARAILAAYKNERGFPVALPMSMCQLVVPDALAATAATITGSEMVPGNVNELNQWGPRGAYRPEVISSPYIDAFVSTSAWLLGDVRGQYVRKWLRRPEVATIGGTGTEAYVRTREGFRVSLNWDCEYGARTFDRVIRNLAATTAPADA